MKLYNAVKIWFDTVYTICICKCLDDHNSGHFDPIKPKSISNINKGTYRLELMHWTEMN